MPLAASTPGTWGSTENCPMRLAIEEKRLTDDRLQAVDAEGLGNEKGGLRRCPGQETLWIGGNEDHRHGESFEDLIDRFETRASVGELNVREDKAWLFAPNGLERLAMGATLTTRCPCSSTRD